MKWLILPAYFLLFSSTAHSFDPNKKFPPNELKKDFVFFRKTMEHEHPRLYEFTSKATFDPYLDSLYNSIKEPMTEREFQFFLVPVVAKIHCSHTRLLPSDSFVSNYDIFYRAPSFKLFYKDDRAYFDKDFSNDSPIPKGTEITAINDIPISQFIQTYKSGMYNEGLNLTWIYNRMNAGVTGLFPGICDTPLTPSYQLSYVDAKTGIKAVAKYKTITQATYDSLNLSATTKEFSFRIMDNTGILTIHSFNTGDYPLFEKFILDAFHTLKIKDTKNLIIDVRNNIGGIPESSVILLQNIMPHSFVYMLKGEGYDELKTEQPLAVDHFNGKVYVLENGACRSTTGHFVAFIKSHKVGTLIGEESCATYSCNNNGSPFILPYTQLKFNCSTGVYEVNCPNLKHGRGVMPDYTVIPDVKDIITGNDPVMKFTQSMIQENNHR